MMEFVAEFTTNHLGNLRLLLKMVERAAWAGATYIKMQKKDVDTFYSRERLDAPYASPYGQTYGEYRSLFEFDHEDFQRFDRACKEHKIPWFCTAQDVPSLRFLSDYDLPLYKVASVNARNHVLLDQMARTIPVSKRIVMSVGGCELSEIADSLSIFKDHQVDLLHCVAEYPCPDEALRLGNITVLRERFGSSRVRVGYSGHEVGINASLAAVALGAQMVERHFALSRHSFAHHIECSLEPAEFKALCELSQGEAATLGRFVDGLPPVALVSQFGMSHAERPFLLEHRYAGSGRS